MSTTVVVNPQGVTVTDPNAAVEHVTGFKLSVGTAAGGPYSASSVTEPIANWTAGAGGSYAVPWASLAFSPALVPFTTYFMVAEAVNASGGSGNSPEVSFSLVSAPSAPTGLVLS